ncbi:MAG: putative lipid II flippase FtsW [Oscillospiraceae bacterium]|nr:putative lipid II flippase FtsW [Oscillospiraceae bacterium]
MESKVISTKSGLFKNHVARGGLDTVFLGLVVVLVTIGIIMMFSASYVNASFNVVVKDRNGEAVIENGRVKTNPYFYFEKQAGFAVLGFVALYLISRVKYTFLKKKWVAYFVLGVSFLLLILVLVNPAKIAGKEEFKRWLTLPVIGQFQPSEVAKLGLIMFCAYHMEKNQKKIDTDWRMMLPYLGIIGAMCVLVYKENHLSGTILMFAIGIVMMFLGGVKSWLFIGGAALVAVFVVITIIAPDRVIKLLESYAGDRITAWINKEDFATTLRWQTNQSLYAIGSGGLFGLGIGNSKQKHLYMPEPHNDFVFAIVCEEIGFIGATVILILFALLIWRGFVIAMRASDRFSALLVMGIIIQVGLQVILNIAVVTDTIPNTGISLPFFSYGGTSLVMLLAEMGIVLSVSRYSKITKK